MTVTRILSLAAAVAIAVGGYVHFDLYRHGYQSIRNIGVLFALNIVLSAAFTAALTMRTDVYTAVAALLFSAGSFGGFVISRSIGLLGFKETGLNPTPQAPITLAAEASAVALLAVVLVRHRATGRVSRPALR